MNIETELIGSEIHGWSYLKPVRLSKARRFADGVAVAIIVATIAAALLAIVS